MRIMAFLRYNTRHSLHFPGDGRLPQMDPTCYRSHDKAGRRTRTLSEPLRVFQLRQRLFCFAGRHRCARRDEPFSYNMRDGAAPDTWDIGPDGNRTCSYCGSIHPDDLMAICRKTLTDDRYGVEGTDKSYKVYVRQPGISNAGDGAIKFYMAHAPKHPTTDQQELFSAAVRVTNERFEAQWKQRKAS
jgi:hypothetical protein